jgi:hypothetical protein
MALHFEHIGTSVVRQPMGMIADSYILPRDADDKAPKWVLDPPFQRGAVWTETQKEAWIESLLADLGLPSIFINRFPKKHPVYGWSEIVIDGQQRCRATAEFMQDKFKVRGELWSEQPLPFQRNFRMSAGIASVVICAYETDRECAELYLRLLKAGTAHTSAEIKKAETYLKKVAEEGK